MREEGGSARFCLWKLHYCDHQFSNRRRLHFSDGACPQQDEATETGRQASGQRLPGLHDVDTNQGGPLPALHN